MPSKKVTAAFEAAFNEANRAGFAAGEVSKPRPIVVTEHSNPLDATSPPKNEWYVSEGLCGFAWVNVTPGNSPFANWLKKSGNARKAYGGGVDIWISAHGQSIERKEAHARAMAAKLKEKLGVTAYAMSRLD